MTLYTTLVSASKFKLAQRLTRRYQIPLKRFMDVVDDFRMSRTAYTKGWAYLALQGKKTRDLAPYGNSRHEFCIAHNVEAVPRPTTSDVDPVRILHETDTSGVVAPYYAEYNDFGLFSLKIVNGGQSKHIANADICLHPIVKIPWR